jgi:hypothetical protein
MFLLKDCPPIFFSVVQHIFFRLVGKSQVIGPVLKSPFLRCDYGTCSFSLEFAKEHIFNALRIAVFRTSSVSVYPETRLKMLISVVPVFLL